MPTHEFEEQALGKGISMAMDMDRFDLDECYYIAPPTDCA